MSKLLTTILIIFFVGILVLLCLFLYAAVSISDDYWDELKNKLEKK